jgi:hypothetical protein
MLNLVIKSEGASWFRADRTPTLSSSVGGGNLSAGQTAFHAIISLVSSWCILLPVFIPELFQFIFGRDSAHSHLIKLAYQTG